MAAGGEVWSPFTRLCGLRFVGPAAGPFRCSQGITSEFRRPVNRPPHQHGEELRVIKRFAPFAMIFAAACGGGDGTGVKTPPSDISTMAVGEVRLLNPTDIPNGIDLPAGSGARDYIIVVGNTNSAHDVVANYVVKADRSPTT